MWINLRGVTFIELIIGLALGSFVIAAILGLYIRFAGTSSHLVTQLGIVNELDTVLGMMSRDIRRAGYWRFEDPAFVTDNPFTAIGTDLQTGSYGGMTPDSCLTYAYDLNRDGLFSHGNNELFGFRRRDNAIEMRTAGASPGCSAGSWQKITPLTMRVTSLTFTIEREFFDPYSAANTCQDSACQLIRRVHITLSAGPADNTDNDVTMTSTILIRNNRTAP